MTTQELITAQYYAWEKRGRGWRVWDYPVELEPPFEAFPGYYIPVADDARQATRLSAFVEKLHNRNALPEPRIDVERLLLAYDDGEPAAYFEDSALTEIQIALPTKSNANKDLSERFLSSLRTAYHPMAFEVIGSGDSITMQFVCREADTSLVRSNLRAYFHEARFQEKSNYLSGRWSELSDKGYSPVIFDFGLSHEFVIPLPHASGLSIDTLTGIVGTLAEVRKDELAVLQMQFQATQHEWANSAIWATTDYAGNSVLANAPNWAIS